MKSLQFILDRRTLEIIYISYIRPILEYASIVWDGCTQGDEYRLENVQLAAARVVSGAMKTTPIVKLYEETGWESLSKRRETSKLIQMYKIVHNLTPNYLRNIFPHIPTPDTAFNYDTRGRLDLPHFRARTDLFDKSFYPSATRLWNLLPLDIRNAPSLSLFKRKLYNPPPRAVKDLSLYYIGKRKPAILHARLRMGRSQLNKHLFQIGIKDSPACTCGTDEDVYHFLFSCPRYIVHRNKLHATVINLAPFTLGTLLFGSSTCSSKNNKLIFLAVQEYIDDTKRFIFDATT